MGKRVLGMWVVVGTATLILVSALLAGFTAGDRDAADRASIPAYREVVARTTPPPILMGRAEAERDDASEEAPDSDPLGDVPEAVEPSEAVTEVAAEDDPEADDHLVDGLPLTASHPLVAPVIEVQNRRTRDLMAHPLVVGTAVGMNEDGEIALIVLARSEIGDLPSSMDGIPLSVFVSGELFAAKGPPAGKGGGGSKVSVDPTSRFVRPVPIGVSAGHPDITAGTIGCRVTDGTHVYALSNNHVFADENGAALSDAIIQPGTYDGGSSPDDDFGTLYEFEPITFTSGSTNTMDAALVSTTTSDLGASTPSDGYGTPRSTPAAPAINLRVRKYGRTTGGTKGRIYAINGTVDVGYDSGVARFVGQVVITPGAFSAGGDSGSLIVGQKGSSANKPVALLFAGSSLTTIATPIDVILDRFGVTVDGD